MLWIDSPVNVVSRLDSTYVGPDDVVDPVRPVLAVSTRGLATERPHVQLPRRTPRHLSDLRSF